MYGQSGHPLCEISSGEAWALGDRLFVVGNDHKMAARTGEMVPAREVTTYEAEELAQRGYGIWDRSPSVSELVQQLLRSGYPPKYSEAERVATRLKHSIDATRNRYLNTVKHEQPVVRMRFRH